MEKLVKSWIKATEIGFGNPGYGDHEWAIDQLIDMHFNGQHDEIWKIILAIVSATDSEWVLKSLGAGPLEDLLRKHADEFLDRIAKEAEGSPKFKLALAEVWLDEEDTLHYKKIYEIVGIAPPFN